MIFDDNEFLIKVSQNQTAQRMEMKLINCVCNVWSISNHIGPHAFEMHI